MDEEKDKRRKRRRNLEQGIAAILIDNLGMNTDVDRETIDAGEIKKGQYVG